MIGVNYFFRILSALVLEQERKVVVFSQWRRMLVLAEWAVRPLLADKGLRSVFFTGQESQKRRTQNIVDLHDDPSTRVLFASDAGGVGLNLQRAASACVNLELPWNPAVLEQRIGRIYRLGQSRPIDVYNLVSSDSIESRIAQLVADKRALFRGLFDGTTDEVEFERSGSFIERLRQTVTSVAVPPKTEKPDPRDTLDEYEDGAERQLENAIDACDEHADPASAAIEPTLVRDDSLPAMSPGDRAETSVAADIARLFSRLSVRHSPDGRMQLEAAAEDVHALAALFEGMGKLLRASET